MTIVVFVGSSHCVVSAIECQALSAVNNGLRCMYTRAIDTWQSNRDVGIQVTFCSSDNNNNNNNNNNNVPLLIIDKPQ